MAFETRVIILLGKEQREMAKVVIDNCPPGLEVVIREPAKQRRRDQNSYAWAGLLKDFSEQGWINGQQFSIEAWHHFLKRECLPDDPEDGITLSGYRKYAESPAGGLILVGSTTKLTVRGFAEYIQRCMAFGSQELGIMFTTNKEYS
jgi:hypothetical protein